MGLFQAICSQNIPKATALRLEFKSESVNCARVCVQVCVRHLGLAAQPNIVTGSHDLHHNQKLPLMGRVFLVENTCVFRQTFILLFIFFPMFKGNGACGIINTNTPDLKTHFERKNISPCWSSVWDAPFRNVCQYRSEIKHSNALNKQAGCSAFTHTHTSLDRKSSNQFRSLSVRLTEAPILCRCSWILISRKISTSFSFHLLWRQDAPVQSSPVS